MTRAGLREYAAKQRERYLKRLAENRTPPGGASGWTPTQGGEMADMLPQLRPSYRWTVKRRLRVLAYVQTHKSHGGQSALRAGSEDGPPVAGPMAREGGGESRPRAIRAITAMPEGMTTL